MNPLFADEPSEDDAEDKQSYVLPRAGGRNVQPPHRDEKSANPAVELIRSKIESLYANEPNAAQDAQEAEQASGPRSKHQEFMHELSTSGKSLAEIQTAWHTYYAALPDEEKQQVWQEFYAANARQPSAYTQYTQKTRTAAAEKSRKKQKSARKAAAPAPMFHDEARANMVVVSTANEQPESKQQATLSSRSLPSSRHTVASIKREVLAKVRARSSAQLKAKHHLQSLAFGIGAGLLVLLVFLFGFFNEVVIAPFIQPGSHANATPIILSTDGVAPSNAPEVIIPKINVEIPVIYGTSNNENDIESDLLDGVAHYPTTSVPGQQGNAAFFGHSSNNIFNPGKYKFAFVLLHTLEPGDIFYITYNGKVYTYKIYDKRVVEPSETWVLNPVASKTATATLITCDPPGTSLHRLVVWGEQISPDPTGNTIAPATQNAQSPTRLADNGPTLWSRFWSWLTSW
ncbi:MAG TPA: class D sortase [Candidatus Saccharimonadales bacterium]|nr:class D sortase [Candidatus Saccharimonadales bacterium]